MTRTILMAALAGLGVAANAAGFSLGSSDVREGGMLKLDQVFNGFGCSGKNIAPELKWTNVPAGTKSMAVTVYDPDAPTGSGWWHWLVVNLPADAKGLPRSSGQPGGAELPAGALQIRTDYGEPGFGGACPPPGDKPHRYIFTAWALKVEKLELPANATAAMVGYNLRANALGKAVLTAKYGR